MVSRVAAHELLPDYDRFRVFHRRECFLEAIEPREKTTQDDRKAVRE